MSILSTPGEIDAAALARIEDVLRLREAAALDPRRTEMIRSIRAIRAIISGNPPEGTAMPTDAAITEQLAAVMRDIASLELTSLGTPGARRARSAATPREVADILDRQDDRRDPENAGLGPDDADAGPTVSRMLLGSRLRRLREQAGIFAAEAASEIRGSESKISRIELGKVGVKMRDVTDLLRLYSVEPDESKQVVRLAERCQQPGWWQRYSDILPYWFQDYLGLETAARMIRIHETRFVPDLLQTPEYAAAALKLADVPPDTAERHVLVRKQRQRRFENGRVNIWAVVDEAALRRPIGGKQTLLGQLRHLLEAASAPNLALQITPNNTAYLSPGPFSILRFAELDMPDVVYLETLSHGLQIDREFEVRHYRAAMDQLAVTSASAYEASRILMTIIKQVEGDL
jgi:transcriptional regulator with XRE-family HTH domain